MPDVFLSYTSHDRPWAERLFRDLERTYSLSVFWDQDRKSLPVGEPYRPALIAAIKKTTHLVVLGSKKARDSGEVLAEIAAFQAHADDHPKIDGVQRRLFFIPLDSTDFGGLKDVQSLVAIRDDKVYDPSDDVTDRGVSKLTVEPAQTHWDRIVEDIGTAVQAPSTTVTLAIVAMNTAMAGELNQVLTTKLIGPTLQDLLDACGLTLPQVQARYHESAFDWQPFGADTVFELMNRVRVEANARLKGCPQYQFHWKRWDLLKTVRLARNRKDLHNALEQLTEKPFVIVVDPITLHHPLLSEVFKSLGPYTKREQSIFIALAATQQPFIDTVYENLVSRGAPALDEFFQPNIPATGPLWGCALNVQHTMEIERLIRGSLGVVHRESMKTQQKPLLTPAG